MHFSDPIYLLLLLPALGWMLFVARGMHGMARARRRVAVALRVALVTLIVLALAGLQTARMNRGITTIFVMDRSGSMSAAEIGAAEAFVKKSLEALGTDDKAGLVTFGKNPVVDVNTGSLRSLGRIYANPDPSATDLAAAIRLASATFSDGTARRLVVLSDGNETVGDAAQAAQAAAMDGIQIDVVKPDAAARGGAEVVLSDVETPEQVTKGEPFQIRVLADATAATTGVIRVDRDGVPVARMPVNLSKGQNAFVMSQQAEAPGFYKYRAVLETEGDTDARNNVGMGFVGVKGRPRILLLEGAPGASLALAKAIQAHDMDVTRGGAGAVPLSTNCPRRRSRVASISVTRARLYCRSSSIDARLRSVTSRSTDTYDPPRVMLAGSGCASTSKSRSVPSLGSTRFSSR